MSATTTRPARPARPAPRPAPVAVRRRGDAQADLLAGGLAGTVAALLGLLAVALPVLVVWAGEDRSGTGVLAAVRSAGHLWLLAHGVALEVPGGRLGLVPLGLAALPAWLGWRAGRRAASSAGARTARDALTAAAGVALLYTGVAIVVAAAVAGSGDVTPVLWTVPVGPLLLAGAAAAGGALRALPATRPSPLAERWGSAVAAGSAAALLLGACGALLVGLALTLGSGDAAAVAEVTEPGAVGGLGLLLLGAVLSPNAAVWGASWLAGPGFAVGAGTAVGPFGVTLGPVPALPLLTALPEGTPGTPAAVVGLVVPVLCGVAAGVLLLDGAAPVRRRIADAAAAGATAGLLLGLLAALSSGPLGGERLAVMGPSAWRVALAVALPVAVGSFGGATAATALVRRRA